MVETGKLILKCIWNHRGPRISKGVLKKKNKVGNINQGLVFAVRKLTALLGRLDIYRETHTGIWGSGYEYRCQSLTPGL